MLPYLVRLALRHFSRTKVYSSIIVMSLTVGFACTCLLVSFLVAESSVDSFHSKKDNIFQVSSNDPFGGTGRIVFITGAARDYMAGSYPEVKNICQIIAQPKSEIQIGESFSAINLIQADTSFFSLFDFPLLPGSSHTPTPGGLMISSAKALQLFGSTDVLGRTVVVKTEDTTRTLAINAVIGKTKEKSHLVFDAIVSNHPSNQLAPDKRPGGAAYVLLHDNADASALMAKVNSDSLRPTLIAPGQMDYYLNPLQRSYFNASNRMPFMTTRSETFIWVGWIVCGLILFMASFNFINLFLLSMQERKMEQGIRKTLGVSIAQVVRSLTVETSLYVVSSFVISLVFVYLLIPVFNDTLETDIAFAYLSKFTVIASIGLSVFVLGLVAILFSVLQQRHVLPVNMMKNTTSKVRVSKLFFTLQFFVSITLCVCSITIIRQMNFIENEPLGFNRNILQVSPPSNGPEFKNRILQVAGINHAALAAGNPITGNMIVRYELEDGKLFTPFIFSGDEDFIATLDLKLTQGSLDLKNVSEKLVNETLVKHFNMADPIGMTIPGTEDRIAGVVKDFTCASFKQEIPPVIISYNANANQLLIDYSGTDLVSLLPKVRAAWSEMFPNELFGYKIIQQDLMKKYSEETLFYKIVVASSITSMIISCFGLFALSWAVIKSRAREMGIRKILGAGAADVLRLLTASFAKRLLVAFVLAAPAGYYMMDLWLSRFVYKVTMSAWIFVAAAVVLATITVVTLGIQTTKASLSSPLDEIRE
ncbi:MAG TPA: FtsX-like permease family protein [Cyclobacteriaceae bacterium]|nr:FtsX-like permease family protein [Cyclobacteriaceae bacterium]